MDLKTRLWWQPARKAEDRLEHRTVSFLELFYDLVYVALVAQLSHALAAHLDLKHLVYFIFLFAIVWWSWLNGSTYHEYHGNNDIRTRVFTFAQMFAVAGMAVFAHNAIGEGSKGFALFYGLFQLILSILWWRLAAHDPKHHIENRPFVIAFSISTLLFFVSIAVATPWRYYLWAFAVLLSLLQPLFMFMLRPKRSEARQPIYFSHALVERFGLFNILVLAEIIVGVVSALAGHHHLDASIFITAGLGMGIAVCMWWLYFDFVSHRTPLVGQASSTLWVYMHLFVSMSIVATAASVLHIVEHTGEPLEAIARWALLGAVAVYSLSLALLMQVISIMPELKHAYNTGTIVLVAIALLCVLLGFSSLATMPLLLVIVASLLVPVLYAVVFWVRVLEAADIQRH